MNLPPSTPIQARQNPEVYTVIIIAICVIILISLGKFIVSQFTQKNKKKPSKKILRTLTEKYHLTEKELSFLWEIIKENKVSNIAEFLTNTQELDILFKNTYEKITSGKKEFFALREKLEYHAKSKNVITSTKTIPISQKIHLITEKNDHYEVVVQKNDKQGLFVTIPKNIFGDFIKPNALEKIQVYFEIPNELAYKFTTHILGYENLSDNFLILAHTNKIEIINQRLYRRTSFNFDCYFSPVQVITGGNGKTPNMDYKILEKKHHGVIKDMSGGGCSIQSPLNIKANQYMYVHFQSDTENEIEFIGLVVQTTLDESKENYIYHVKFVRVNQETRIRIYEMIYGYEKNQSLDHN
ncbi:MAG: PilZ domain-containing protein [Spirochaetaceae bacterium]|nr:PilZ domain-containing protein [Spirochaetaceae bacterium]